MDRCLATPLFAAGACVLRVAGQPVDSADSPSELPASPSTALTRPLVWTASSSAVLPAANAHSAMAMTSERDSSWPSSTERERQRGPEGAGAVSEQPPAQLVHL
jgi:hypothetical protein